MKILNKLNKVYTQAELRKLFDNSKAYNELNDFKNFIIRIRDPKDNGKIKKDLVYYEGNKAFEIDSNGNIEFPISTYTCNTSSIKKYGKSIYDNIKIICTYMNKYFEFSMSEIRFDLANMCNDRKSYEKIKEIKQSMGSKDFKLKYINSNYNLLMEQIELFFLDYPNIKLINKIIDIEPNYESVTIKFETLNDINDIINLQFDFITRIKLGISTEGKVLENYLKNITFDFKANDRIENKLISYDEFVKLDSKENLSFLDTIKKSINSYKGKEELEKKYQHQFMLFGKNLKDIFGDSDNLYYFEQEYGIKNENKSGRIDCVFYRILEGTLKEIYLIELKVDEKVILGNNGILTHLKDIKEFLNTNQKEELERRIIYRHKVIFNEISVGANIEYKFYTILGYTNNNYVENKEKVIKKIFDKQKVKKLDYIDEIMKKLQSPSGVNELIELNELPIKFKNKSIYDYTNGVLCEFRFLKEVTPWNPNRTSEEWNTTSFKSFYE